MQVYSEHDDMGIRRIRMEIKTVYGLMLSNRTIYRYMRINGVQATVRVKQRVYPRVAHHDILNELQRNFTTERPNQKWSIDITYIFCRDRLTYMCAIKDLYDKSIISYQVSSRIDLPLVLDTVRYALLNVNESSREGLILHSDQGWHFTHLEYCNLLKKHRVKQSISYKGSSVDNVPIESFFAIFKTECIYRHKGLYSDNVKQLIDKYMWYYNNKRLQEKIKELAPVQYRNLALEPLFI